MEHAWTDILTLSLVIVLVISMLITLFLKNKHAIKIWWKKNLIWNFLTTVLAPFLIPFIITLVLEFTDEDTSRSVMIFLLTMCLLTFFNLIFQFIEWKKERKNIDIKWENFASQCAYNNLYDVIKEKVNQYGEYSYKRKKTEDELFCLAPENIPYDIFEHIRRICLMFQSTLGTITGINTLHTNVSFIYHYTYKGANEDDKKWRWLVGKDSDFDIDLNDFTDKDTSLYHYMISNHSSLEFYNDKKEAANIAKYYYSYKDFLHDKKGSVFAAKITFANNEEICCEGIIMVTTYGENFVKKSSIHTEEEFKKLVVDKIFPCYKNMLKSELGMLYFRHSPEELEKKN